LVHELTEVFIGLHQMRFNLFLYVPVHSWLLSLSGVGSPNQPWNSGRPGGLASLLVEVRAELAARLPRTVA
jgi:hypothetical protein